MPQSLMDAATALAANETARDYASAAIATLAWAEAGDRDRRRLRRAE